MVAFLAEIITNPLFSVATLLLGFLIGDFLAIGRDRKNNFNKAADEFFAAFQNELTRLKPESTPTYDIINPTITKHLGACSMFRRHLKGCELGRFKLAQHKYYFSTPLRPTDNEEDRNYQDERTALIERIEELLDFAKFK